MGLGGAQRIRDRWPSDVTLIAVLPPDLPTLYQRLKERDTTDADLEVRWPHVTREVVEARSMADCVIINAELETATHELARTIQQHHQRQSLKF